MGQTLAGKDQWYVVHVLSGQENKVRENILKRIKTEEMADLIASSRSFEANLAVVKNARQMALQSLSIGKH